MVLVLDLLDTVSTARHPGFLFRVLVEPDGRSCEIPTLLSGHVCLS